MENQFKDNADHDQSSIRIELMTPAAARFPKSILGGHSFNQFCMMCKADGGLPIGVIEQGGRSAALVSLPNRKFIAMIGDKRFSVDSEDFGRALFDALDDAAYDLWGHAWNSAIAEIYHLNRRTTQRDRVQKNFLPANVLHTIAHLSSNENGPAMATNLLAIAGLHKSFNGNEPAVREAWQFTVDAYFGSNDEGLRVVKGP